MCIRSAGKNKKQSKNFFIMVASGFGRALFFYASVFSKGASGAFN